MDSWEWYACFFGGLGDEGGVFEGHEGAAVLGPAGWVEEFLRVVEAEVVFEFGLAFFQRSIGVLFLRVEGDLLAPEDFLLAPDFRENPLVAGKVVFVLDLREVFAHALVDALEVRSHVSCEAHETAAVQVARSVVVRVCEDGVGEEAVDVVWEGAFRDGVAVEVGEDVSGGVAALLGGGDDCLNASAAAAAERRVIVEKTFVGSLVRREESFD